MACHILYKISDLRRISLKKILILLIILLACVGCDQGTKYTARHFLADRPTLTYMGDTFRLEYAENSGGFLSVGARLPGKLRQAVFITLVSLFLIGLLFFTLYNKEFNTLAVSSGALIISGGFSNLIDRVINKGLVIDFMNVGIGPIRTGIFNVADMAIMTGIFMLAVFYIKNHHNKSVNT
jgi:signal peptidase II